jgi:hypothetical protein
MQNNLLIFIRTMIIEIEDKVLFKGTRLEDSWIKNGADLIDRVSLKLRAKKMLDQSSAF